MKIIASTLAVLLAAAPAAAQEMERLTGAYEMMRASANLDRVIDGWTTGDTSQPVCVNDTDNYIRCISVPDDIDDTEFIVDPVLPGGVKIGQTKGTPDYDLGIGLISALRNAADIGGCDESGKFGMANYRWLSQTDITAPVSDYFVRWSD